MKLSFTLDEKIFSEVSPKNLLEEVASKNISAFELSPDTDILELNEYENIVNMANSNKLDINYHIPYFANEIYELEHFSSYEKETKEKYLDFLTLLDNFQENLCNSPIIVVHGADYNEKDRQYAMDNTLKFLDWILNIITKKNLPFTIALETLRKCKIRNTLDNRNDIFSIINNFESESLKICWDMCHDKLNFYPKETPIPDDFLNKVIYSHIHGHNLDTDISHISLEKSNLDYSLELKSLSSFNSSTINIELLSNFTNGDYLVDLFKDINYMSKYI